MYQIRSLYSLTSLLVLCLIVFSCRKDINSFLNEAEPVQQDLLQIAKVYHASHATQSEASIKDYEKKVLKLKNPAPRARFKKINPQWKNARTIKAGSQELIIVPTSEVKLSSSKLKVRRFFVFKTKNNGITSGEIIEIIGENYDPSEHLDELLTTYEKHRIVNFTGAILRYDLNYYLQSKTVFDNGNISQRNGSFAKLPAKTKSGKSSRISATSNTNKGTMSGGNGTEVGGGWGTGGSGGGYVGPCAAVYWYTWAEDQFGNVLWENYEFLYYEGDCSDTGGGTSPGDETGGEGTGGLGTTTNEGNPGGGGYGGNDANENGLPATVDVDIKDPCILSAYQLIPTDLNNTVTDILTETFGTTSRINLKLRDVSMSGTAPASTVTTKDKTKNGLRFLDVTMNLNKSVLPNASKQYIVATILHETIHAFFQQDSVFYDNQFLQHEAIGKGYIDEIRAALIETFPTMSVPDANALVLFGLGDVADKNPTLYNKFLTHCSLTAQQVYDTGVSYKSGDSGVKCPT